MAEQDIVAVPDPVSDPGVIDPQASPVGTVSVRETIPPNPLRAAIVTVVALFVPALTVIGVVELMVKSWKRKTVVAV